MSSNPSSSLISPLKRKSWDCLSSDIIHTRWECLAFYQPVPSRWWLFTSPCCFSPSEQEDLQQGARSCCCRRPWHCLSPQEGTQLQLAFPLKKSTPCFWYSTKYVTTRGRISPGDQTPFLHVHLECSALLQGCSKQLVSEPLSSQILEDLSELKVLWLVFINILDETLELRHLKYF